MFCPAGFIPPEQPQVNCGDAGQVGRYGTSRAFCPRKCLPVRTLCSGSQVSRLKPELYAASELRRHRRMGASLRRPAPLDSGSIFKPKMLQSPAYEILLRMANRSRHHFFPRNRDAVSPEPFLLPPRRGGRIRPFRNVRSPASGHRIRPARTRPCGDSRRPRHAGGKAP